MLQSFRQMVRKWLNPKSRPYKRNAALAVEELENRIAPVGAIWTVTNVQDDGAGSLRWAVAQSDASGDFIRFDRQRLGANPLIQLDSSINTNKDLNIDGAGCNVTVTRAFANRNQEYRAFFFSNGANSTNEVIKNVTFSGFDTGGNDGGAILAWGSLTLEGVSFLSNTGDQGGAVAVVTLDDTDTVTITGGLFQSNIANSASNPATVIGGGAVFVDTTETSAAVTIDRAIFNLNRTRTGGDGGGVAVTGFGSLNITSATFTGNSGRNGGGVFADCPTLIVTNAMPGANFNSNTARRGGAIYWDWRPGEDDGEDAVLRITNVEFLSNSAATGGAVYIRTATDGDTTTETITGCLFYSNRATVETDLVPRDQGGGLYSRNDLSGNANTTLAIINTTFYQNRSNDDGGGLAIRSSNGGVGAYATELTSLTVSENQALNGAGGGIFLFPGETPTIWNTIVANNRAMQAPDIRGGVVSNGFNLIGIADATNAANWIASDITGTAINPIDGGLDPQGLKANGGLTRTLAVPATSRAYRAGDPALQGFGNANDVHRFDQRSRLRNDRNAGNQPVVTIGAYDQGQLGNAANNPPVGFNASVSTAENKGYVFSSADFGFTDPNDSAPNGFVAVQIVSGPDKGQLFNDGRMVVTGDIIGVSSIESGGLVYYPAVGEYGNSYTTFAFKVQDDGGTANGGVDTDATARTMTIDVTGVNNAPVGTDTTVTTLKNTSYVFAVNNFGFTDPGDSASPNALLAVKITTLPEDGELQLDGNAVSVNDTISVSDILNGLLTFVPVANATGVHYASFGFKDQDDGGAEDDGVDTDSEERAMTVNVMDTAWVNAAPEGADYTITAKENIAYIIEADDFGFSDPSNSPANTLLSVKITTLPTGGILTDNGVAVSVGDFISISHIDAGLLQYRADANQSGTAYDAFGFEVRDDGGIDSSGDDLDDTERIMTIDVLDLNQAPAGEDNTVVTMENEFYVFEAADFGFTDLNDASPNEFTAVKITSLPMFGVLTLDGEAVETGDVISVDDIENGLLVFTSEENVSGNMYDGFLFQVQDDGGIENDAIDTDPIPKMMTIDVTWVNQSPEGMSSTVVTDEDTPYVLTAADFGFSDPNDAEGNWLLAVKITSLPEHGTLTNNGIAVNENDCVILDDIFASHLVFTPAENENDEAYAIIGFRVQDDGGIENGGDDLDHTERTITIDVASVNDAPVNTIPEDQETDEDTDLVFSTANANLISIADVDADTSEVEVTLTATNGILTLATVSGITFTNSTSNGSASMSFTGTIADINTALDGLIFSPTADYNGSASVRIQTNDQGNTGSGGALDDDDTVNITVNAVNDAPVNTIPEDQETDEDTDLVFSTANANLISIADVDADTSEVEVTLTATNGILTLATVSGITFTNSTSNGSASMSFTGTIADINTALDGLIFSPTADYNGSASVRIQTDDQGNTGSGGALDDDDTVNITINAVNDAPVNAVPATQSTSENNALILSTGNGNVISIADVDAGSSDMQVTLTATNGIVTLSTTSGITFAIGSSNGTATMTFTGTISAINSALDGLTFTPTTDYRGNATVRIQTDDQGNTGSGGTLSDDDTITILVNGATISGFVWDDSDEQDGIQDEGEDAIDDVQVDLLAYVNESWTVVATTYTDSYGLYSFGGLAAGNYKIQVQAPSTSWNFTLQDQGSDDEIDSDVNSSGEKEFALTFNQDLDLDAGLFSNQGSGGSGI